MLKSTDVIHDWEENLLLQAAGKWRPAFEFLLLTGLRGGELRLLNVEDLRPDGILHAPLLKKRGDDPRDNETVWAGLHRSDVHHWHERPLGPVSIQLIRAMAGDRIRGPLLPGKGKRHRLNRSSMSNAFSRLWGALDGRPDVTLHGLRHTFATRYLREGGRVEVLQRLLGHSSINTTMKYVHFSIEELRTA